MANWLSAADIFVLPTVAEGSCNAILEAMGCGLPVISSDIPSNREILDPSMSILVDPMNISQIKKAIVTLADDAYMRKTMGLAALKQSRGFGVRDRAQRILTWIKESELVMT